MTPEWEYEEEEAVKEEPQWQYEVSDEEIVKQQEDAIRKSLGVHAAEEKTAEDIRKMTLPQKREYIEELKREREYSQVGGRGILKGLSFGLTEYVPGLQTLPGEGSEAGEFVGSILPISGIMKVFGYGAVKLAAKSPILRRQASALLKLLGVGAAGATYEGATELAKGKIPTADDLLQHGEEWIAIDLILKATGKSGQFVKSLLTKAKNTSKPSYQVLNDVMNELRESGVDFSTPEIASSKALEILERPLTQSEEAFSAVHKKIGEAEGIAQEALQKQQEAQKAITPAKLKSKKIEDSSVSNLTNEAPVLSEVYQPENINFTTEAESLEKTALDAKIDQSGTRAATEKELGETIKADIEGNLKKEKEAYKPFYDTAKKEAADITHTPSKTGREAGEKLISLEKVKTRPVGYATTLRSLETALEDAGFVISRNKEGIIESIVADTKVPVSKTIELASRLNEIINYEAIEPEVKNVLKKVARAAKADIRTGLASNPDALAAFELAEQEHARVAKKYGKESISKIRTTEAGEKITKIIDQPSMLSDLKETLNPKQMKQVEREILEKLNKQSYEKSKEQLREIKKYLSEENQKLAQEIVESKNPHNPIERRKVAQEGILDDLATAFNDGSRPEKTLKLWKTEKGQKLVKEALEGSPNYETVKTYLEKQSFNDMVASVLKPNGEISPDKIKTFMKDPAMRANIKAIGGQDAVNFFDNIGYRIKQSEANTKVFEFLKRSREEQAKLGTKISEISKEKLGEKGKVGQAGRIAKESTQEKGNELLKRMKRKDYPLKAKVDDFTEWAKDALGLNAQAAMNVFGAAKLIGGTFGVWSVGIPTAIKTFLGYKIMNKMLTSKKVRKAFIEATKKHVDPVSFIMAWEAFGESIEE